MEQEIAAMSHTDLVAGFVAQIEVDVKVGRCEVGPVGQAMWREIVSRMDAATTNQAVAPERG